MRVILRLARKALTKTNTLKTKMALTTFLIATCFVFTSIAFMWSFVANYWFGDRLTDEHERIVLINTPDSFREFSADEFYMIDGFLSTKEMTIASYDFVQIYKTMDINNAFAAVVFPENFDETIKNTNGIPEILTYYQYDLLEHKDDADTFINDILIGEYQEYLRENYRSDSISNDSEFELTETPVVINNITYEQEAVATILPLIIFIATLYIAMTTGTNVIAGEKENGTFAGIIMTPVKRSYIITGNFLGCFIASSIPGTIAIFTFYFYQLFGYGNANILGFILSWILVLTLAAFVTAITILISTMNNSTLSAQTAFLPVFLIFLVIAISCIQNVGASEVYNYVFPIYAHFYGIGYILTEGQIVAGFVDMIPPLIASIILSILLTVLLLFIATRMLFSERFISTSEGITLKQIRDANKKHILPRIPVDYLFDQLVFPLITLSVFQVLAMIPAAVHYMADSNYSDFILSLKDVSNIEDIFDRMGSILAIFLGSPIFLFCMGIGYILLILTYAAKIVITEHNYKPFASMGLIRDKALKNYFKGLLYGFIMLSSVVVFLLITRSIAITGIAFKASQTPILLLSVFMWTIQGAAEEVMFRGYMLKRVESKCGKKFAIIFSSILFAALHGANVGFTVLAGINLFLVAVLFALMYYRTGSLYITCAAHTAWNFCQGTLYGLEVSGSESSLAILKTSYSSNCLPLFSGGSFGPEGGLGVTLISVIVITAILILDKKDSAQKGA